MSIDLVAELMRRIHASYIDGSSTDPPAYVTFSAILSTSEILQTRRPTADTRLYSASSVGCRRGAARICCTARLQLSIYRALSSKPAAATIHETDRQTDRQTDRRTLERHIDAAVDAMRLVSITQRPACRYSAVIAYAAIIISRLSFALPAWGGFLSVELVNRINTFFRRLQRFGYLQCRMTSRTY